MIFSLGIRDEFPCYPGEGDFFLRREEGGSPASGVQIREIGAFDCKVNNFYGMSWNMVNKIISPIFYSATILLILQCGVLQGRVDMLEGKPRE